MSPTAKYVAFRSAKEFTFAERKATYKLMHIALKETRLGLRNSTTRLPFRYGKACLTRCPQAVFRAVIEVDGQAQAGYSGDCLPPSWFDKAPGKAFDHQIEDMLWVIAEADASYRTELALPGSFFAAWQTALADVHAACVARDLPPLLASFGASVVERAILDAICRAKHVSFAKAVRDNLFGLVPGDVHPQLTGLQPRDWLPPQPRDSIYVRHTVGLSDPLTAGDIPMDERLDDGFPQALEEYVERCGLRYLKIKVSNQLERDIERLMVIAAIVQRHRGDRYGVTLDGNEQYSQAGDFDGLIEAIRREPALETLWSNVFAVEQPLERGIALSAEHTGGIRELSQTKPVIIDESDGTLDSYSKAIELGYRGISSKCCKGAVKSLLNAGLTWLYNDRGRSHDYIMTGEDLCSVGIVPVQSDLCLVATLGLEHIERNGHHYHRGLSYLPRQQQVAALAVHGDLYAEQNGIVAPRLVDGRFQIGSLQCAGFGFAVEPDMSAMRSPDEWEFASLQ
ncbi:MAG: mandelate racemase [Planctomycetota bacterium]|nr:mandelate racemase [Planctomycetota bacterium]